MPKAATHDAELLQAALIGLEHQQEEMQRRIAEIRAQLHGSSAPVGATGAPRKRRTMSAAARKRIAAAQRKRWAEYHATMKSGK